MKLNPEQSEKALAFIKSKWKPPIKCSCCGSNNWSVTSNVFQLISYTAAGSPVGGPVVPLFPVTCNNCGNTILINAIIAGLVEPPKSAPQVEAAQNAK